MRSLTASSQSNVALRDPVALAVASLAAIAASGLVLWAVGSAIVAAAFLAGVIAIMGIVVLARRLGGGTEPAAPVIDWTIARALASGEGGALAVTDRAGRLVCANDRYEAAFGGFVTPPSLPVGDAGVAALTAAGRTAWRDGMGGAPGLVANGAQFGVTVERSGAQEDLLVWRFVPTAETDLAADAGRLLGGSAGDALGRAGVMAALMAPQGRAIAANRVLRLRAMGHEEGAIEGRDFASMLTADGEGAIRFASEGPLGRPLRIVHVPLAAGSPSLLFLIDDDRPVVSGRGGAQTSEPARALVDLLPFGLALVDRDGRFIHMNEAFARAAHVEAQSPPVYPGDLVIREDKAAVADAVRRHAGGNPYVADMAVRLRDHPDEPVALTIAGARGLGEAAVLLSLKDNSEESKLKRQVAQATKMQAVGQLAGGVAHDFNNILTAIIGHCDLMLMRHTPGDSDYDDIQQIKANSNRAAGLTRQLLAFSRQQTLRPQVLQLPDVISEVSNLLKRLLGETVTLQIKHGRDLGAVRADPGQLEQVIINLAVNARDAMQSKGSGGVLTIQTRAVSVAEARRMGDDLLPQAEYTALSVSDTGTGIPAEALPKIFEPFFTTKDVGKGTGLGLSTVYGIVKQSGGFIFADSAPGKGATFTIYLPVHRAEEAPKVAPPPAKERVEAAWGSGTILLVEDEAMVRAVAERALVRHGYTVLTAEHGEAALELLEDGANPDLMVSDVVMPTMDGPTLVRHARQRYPSLPILFMSGYAEEQLRKSIDLDNVAFLPKPFSVQDLAAAVQVALARHGK
ncbi:response regulator [Sphingomonas gilva]|uniref:histidine kinase n=1 Tax=Sphingomonas gilva TaxID=2305907 RepID=A0A396RQ70_9SPHN|nr:response regulator [Sphingomonas gilva]RHW16423.1 response regulator [Sphingomonas gilva]